MKSWWRGAESVNSYRKTSLGVNARVSKDYFFDVFLNVLPFFSHFIRFLLFLIFLSWEFWHWPWLTLLLVCNISFLAIFKFLEAQTLSHPLKIMWDFEGAIPFEYPLNFLMLSLLKDIEKSLSSKLASFDSRYIWPKIFILRICRINFFINGYKYLECLDLMD